MNFSKKKIFTACEDDKPSDDLGIASVGGVFLVLAGGCLVALIVATLEFLWNVEKIAIEEKANIYSFNSLCIIFLIFKTFLDIALGCIKIRTIFCVQHMDHYEAGSLKIEWTRKPQIDAPSITQITFTFRL